MKKVLLLAMLSLFCLATTVDAQQTRKERRDAKREAARKKRMAARAMEARMDSVAFLKAMDALENGSFVLEADNIMFPNGVIRYVTSSTNYVQVVGKEGILQTAFSNFSYSPGPNGLGGVTVDRKSTRLNSSHKVSTPEVSRDEHGNVHYKFNITGIAVSATVSITLTGGTNEASAYISPNFNNNNITMTGHIVPYDESVVFQGTTW